MSMKNIILEKKRLSYGQKKSGRLIRVNRETFSDAESYFLLRYIFQGYIEFYGSVPLIKGR